MRRLHRLLAASWVLGLLASSAIVVSIGAQVPQQPANSPEQAPKNWVAVLNAYLSHDDASKRTVDDAASHAEDPRTCRLAAILQQEWDFHSNAEALARPRQVFMPKLPADLPGGQPGAAAESETFTFDITIGRQGFVTSAEFRNPPRQPALGAIARTRVLHALYRPVFDGREFISFPAVVTSSIDIK